MEVAGLCPIYISAAYVFKKLCNIYLYYFKKKQTTSSSEINDDGPCLITDGDSAEPIKCRLSYFVSTLIIVANDALTLQHPLYRRLQQLSSDAGLMLAR